MPKSKQPIINSDGTLHEESLPWRPEPSEKEMISCEGKEVFNQLLELYQNHMVYQKPIEYIIDTLSDMCTYHMDKWDSTMYLGYFGSGNEKGKSTALKIHKMVAYRGCPISTGTDAAFRKCLTEGGTLLCDQAENLFYEGSNQKKTFMYNAFTSGYTRDFKHIQLDPADSKSFDCKELFGAKMYSMQEDGVLDNPIRQRTYAHYMLQGVPRIKNMLRNPESVKNINEIFCKLHYLKIQKYKELDYDTGLFGRTGELIDPLLLGIQLYNIPYWVEKQIYTAAFEMMDEKRDISTDTLPATIYYAIPRVTQAMKQFTATHIKTYILQHFSTIWTEKTAHEVAIGKNLHLMGFKNIKLGGMRIYDIEDKFNQQILEKLKSQYDNDNSIEILCAKFEEENSVKPDISKTIYERYADYMEIKTMQELARKIHKDTVSGIPIIEPEEKEFEYPCPICHRTTFGDNYHAMCKECAKQFIPED